MKRDYDHLKNIEVGDIWMDRYGDQVLIQEVQKHNLNHNKKKFFLFLDVILLTNVQNAKMVKAGEYIMEYDPSLLVKKVA
jgi:hypothetical protein